MRAAGAGGPPRGAHSVVRGGGEGSLGGKGGRRGRTQVRGGCAKRAHSMARVGAGPRGGDWRDQRSTRRPAGQPSRAGAAARHDHPAARAADRRGRRRCCHRSAAGAAAVLHGRGLVHGGAPGCRGGRVARVGEERGGRVGTCDLGGSLYAEVVRVPLRDTSGLMLTLHRAMLSFATAMVMKCLRTPRLNSTHNPGRARRPVLMRF